MMLSEYLEVPGKIYKSKNILDSFCSNAQHLLRLALGGKIKRTLLGLVRIELIFFIAAPMVLCYHAMVHDF